MIRPIDPSRNSIGHSKTTLWDASGEHWTVRLRVRTPLFPPLMRKRSTVTFAGPSLLGPAAKRP